MSDLSDSQNRAEGSSDSEAASSSHINSKDVESVERSLEEDSPTGPGPCTEYDAELAAALQRRDDEAAMASLDPAIRERHLAMIRSQAPGGSNHYVDQTGHWVTSRSTLESEFFGPVHHRITNSFVAFLKEKSLIERLTAWACHGVTDQYWFESPNQGDEAFRPRLGRVPVYLAHLNAGVRFPLHTFIVSLLNHWRISLAQLVPTAVHRIISFIWVCTFRGVTPTVNLFLAIYRIKPYRGNRIDKGWWTLEAVRTTEYIMGTSYPRIETKGWTREFVWLRVPTLATEPHCYLPRMEFVIPMEPGFLSLSLLDPRERDAWNDFRCYPAQGKGSAEPVVWLPHIDLIRNEPYLVIGGLSQFYTQGKCF